MPRHSNATDCGVYVRAFAEILTRGAQLDGSKIDPVLARMQVTKYVERGRIDQEDFRIHQYAHPAQYGLQGYKVRRLQDAQRGNATETSLHEEFPISQILEVTRALTTSTSSSTTLRTEAGTTPSADGSEVVEETANGATRGEMREEVEEMVSANDPPPEAMQEESEDDCISLDAPSLSEDEGRTEAEASVTKDDGSRQITTHITRLVDQPPPPQIQTFTSANTLRGSEVTNRKEEPTQKSQGLVGGWFIP